MTDIIETETDRLYLRQWQTLDFKPFARLNPDAEVMAFYPSTLSQKESDDLAVNFQSLIEQWGWGFWALEQKVSGHFIGFTGLHIPTHPRVYASN
ncbi:GNAT family N-acetyltransferase [Endozoicomonas montiporae]|uniref:GNAT family N-acetyltransferase n=1 Tax=Endozoicomonas montiporae TaxID=1027273 RepID=UPI0007773D9E|nr:GNAT family N-acetyltransferase [Endozoicomonas montiporae]